MRVLLRTFLVTTLLITPTVVAGQTLGFRGGLSLASFGGDDAGEAVSKAGLSFGGFYNVPVSPILGVQVGAGLAQKGAEETEAGVEIKIKHNYLEIPLLLTFSPPTTGNVGFNFFAGPALGFETGCSIDLQQAGVTVSFDCDEVDLPVKSVDLGGMVGAGLGIGLTPAISLVLDAFYNLGLTKFDDNSVTQQDVKHRAFSVLAGLSFSLGG